MFSREANENRKESESDGALGHSDDVGCPELLVTQEADMSLMYSSSRERRLDTSRITASQMYAKIENDAVMKNTSTCLTFLT